MSGGELPQGPVFEVDGRPAPAPRAPPREALREVYEELLAIERQRLAIAVRIERERGFVFPETSVIVRDVRTLAEKVYGPAASKGAGEGEGAAEPESSLDTPAPRARGRAPRAVAAGLAGLDGLDGDEGDAEAILATLGGEP